MILTCEKCNKRYFVRDEEIGPEGRKVRCVICKHTWYQAPHEAIITMKIDPEDLPSNPLAANESNPPRFSLGWMVFCASVVLLGSAAYFGRNVVVQSWPATATAYESLGFEVAVPGKGLKVENVQPQHIEENGKQVLVVRGEVVNTSNNVSVIPPIHVQLMSACTDDPAKLCVAKQWEHAFSESRLLPGERIAFETEAQETVQGVKNLRVQF